MMSSRWEKRDPIRNCFLLPNELFSLGLEAGEIDTYTITLPEGTVKLEFGDYRIVYWSQWT